MDLFPFFTLTDDEFYMEAHRLENYREITLGEIQYIAWNNCLYPFADV